MEAMFSALPSLSYLDNLTTINFLFLTRYKDFSKEIKGPKQKQNTKETSNASLSWLYGNKPPINKLNHHVKFLMKYLFIYLFTLPSYLYIHWLGNHNSYCQLQRPQYSYTETIYKVY